MGGWAGQKEVNWKGSRGNVCRKEWRNKGLGGGGGRALEMPPAGWGSSLLWLMSLPNTRVYTPISTPKC